MVRCGIFAAIVLISCTTGVYSQFYDLYQALQPLVQSYSTLTDNPFQQTQTTKRPRTTIRHKTIEQTNRSTSSRRNPSAISGLEGQSRDDSRSREKSTTSKPVRKTSKPQNNLYPKSATNSRNTAREIATQRDTNRNPSRIIFEEPVNNANTYYDTSNTKGPKITYTTQNPLYNRPGVKPAPVDDRRPPITNRPQTIKPEIPLDSSVSPELILGPNEDSMSEVERRRYIELAERMCDKYKSLNTRQVQGIPLVPSPEPIQVNVTSCVPSNVPLVVGGKAVSIKQFPHMALLGWLRLHSSGYAWRCGGSLISNQFVLTAAHCAYDERDNSIVRGPPRVVQLGSSYLDDPEALVIKVASVIRHPKYVQPKSYYDLTLIKLAATVTFSEVIKPACLGVPPPPGKPIIATGWGRTEFGGDLSNELRGVSIPVWDDTECFQILGTSRRLPSGQSPDSQVCAGEKKGGKDTCQGDSGGPAQIQDGCLWRVVAVTSLGRACGAPDTPALYAKVQRAFIAAVAFGKLIPSDSTNIKYATEETYNGSNANRRNTNRQTTEKITFSNGARLYNDGETNSQRKTSQKTPYDNGGRVNKNWNESDRQTTERTVYNNGRVSYDINNNRQTTESNNGGRYNSAIDNNRNVGTNRQTNERTSDNGGRYNSGTSNNRQPSSNNRGTDSSPVSNHRQVHERDTYDVGGNNNHRQSTSNNRGIDNSGINSNRQVNERDIYNNGGRINTDINNNNQRNSNRRTEGNVSNNNRSANQQNGGNYNIHTQNVEKRDRNLNTYYTQSENNNNFGSPYNNQFHNSQPIWA